MTGVKHGGPAFPVADLKNAVPMTTGESVQMARGMALRDYFAAKIIQGICADNGFWGLSQTEMAKEAYLIADAMLAAREGEQP